MTKPTTTPNDIATVGAQLIAPEMGCTVGNEWLECKLGDVLEIKYGKDHKTLNDGDIPVYGSGGIMRYVNDFLYAEESILIPRKGTLDNLFYVKEKFWTVDTIFWSKIDISKTLPKYLFYQLKLIDFYGLNVGSAVPSLTVPVINAIPILLPPLLEQKVIAAVLSSLDDKIDLLHRQNQTLEAMAQTLFRQWFIEEARKDWEEVALCDVVELNVAVVDKYYTHSNIQYLDTGSLTQGQVSKLQMFNIKEAPSRAKRLVKHNDVLISTVRPNQKHYGIIKSPPDDLVVSTGFCVLTCTKIDPHFVYLLLTSEDMTEYLHSIAEGSTSTYPSLKPSDVGDVTFLMPDEKKLVQFANFANNAWLKISRNQQQIQTLTQIRNTLLPKLMSGEIRVEV